MIYKDLLSFTHCTFLDTQMFLPSGKKKQKNKTKQKQKTRTNQAIMFYKRESVESKFKIFNGNSG